MSYFVVSKTFLYYREKNGRVGSLVPNVGFISGTILHLKSPKNSFLQNLTSVEMYRSGCSQKVKNIKLCSKTNRAKINISLHFERNVSQ